MICDSVLDVLIGGRFMVISKHFWAIFIPGIRQKHPDKDWFQVAGLIHDIGKVMALYGEPQWCVVGDTFPVGCAPARSIVFDAQFFEGLHFKEIVQKTIYSPTVN